MLLLFPFLPQAEASGPAAAMDDEGVIERLVSQLQAGTAGLPAGYKLSPIQFEKVSAGVGLIHKVHA